MIVFAGAITAFYFIGREGSSDDLAGDSESVSEVDPIRGLYGFGRIAEFSTSDMNDNTVTNDIFSQNKLTFINYWATWCGPCRDELPDFQPLYDKYGDDITFVTVIDDGVNNDAANELVDEYLSFCINILPTENLLKALSTGYVPTSIIVDRDGNLVFEQIIGAKGDEYAQYLDLALETVNYYENQAHNGENPLSTTLDGSVEFLPPGEYGDPADTSADPAGASEPPGEPAGEPENGAASGTNGASNTGSPANVGDSANTGGSANVGGSGNPDGFEDGDDAEAAEGALPTQGEDLYK